MRFGNLILMSLAVLITSTGHITINQASATEVGDIAAGKKLAEKLCSKCHSVAKTGTSTNEKAPAFRTFVQKWPIENLEEALAEGIVVGEHTMPEFEFEPRDITRLLAYIGSLSK